MYFLHEAFILKGDPGARLPLRSDAVTANTGFIGEEKGQTGGMDGRTKGWTGPGRNLETRGSSH